MRRRINAEASRRETAQQFVKAVKMFETEVEERVLLVALTHLLNNGDAQAFVQEPAHRRYLDGVCMEPGTEEAKLFRRSSLSGPAGLERSRPLP